jgi:hypothetical protein
MSWKFSIGLCVGSTIDNSLQAWPMAIANGELDREPKETQIDDILSL